MTIALLSSPADIHPIMEPEQWDVLVSPIPGPQPQGIDLRYEGTYDRILQARREDDPALEQGVWKRDLKKADWVGVQVLCREALSTKTKDFTLSVWLLDAWMHVFGFPGVTQGLALLTEMCQRYWQEGYPIWDPENPEPRFAPFLWMNEKLTLHLKQLPLCVVPSEDGPVYSWADWEQALRLDQEGKRNPDLLESRAAQGKVTREKFLQCVEATPAHFYSALVEECRNILGLCEQLDRVLDASCGTMAPGLAAFKSATQAIMGFSSNIVREASEEHEALVELSPKSSGIESASSFPSDEDRQVGNTIGSRDEAYARLLEAAEYLQIHEPHSLTPYLIKRAVSWGQMTLSEVFEDVGRHAMDVQGIYALLGVSLQGAKRSPDMM